MSIYKEIKYNGLWFVLKIKIKNKVYSWFINHKLRPVYFWLKGEKFDYRDGKGYVSFIERIRT